MTDLAPYAAVFLDIAAWAPDLRPALERDYERLVQVSLTRGVSFVMIDMPEVGKVLDHSLSRGWFPYDSLPRTFGAVKRRVHTGGYFLGKLFLRVFDEDGRLREDVDPKSIDFLRQVLYLAKKVKVNCSDAARDEAVRDFVRIEDETRLPSMTWMADELTCQRNGVAVAFTDLSFLDGYREHSDLFSDRDRISKNLIRLLDDVTKLVARLFPVVDYDSLLPRHGPGAVADIRTGGDKYRFPNWPTKLDRMFNYEQFALARPDLIQDCEKPPSHGEPSAKLHAVLKTLKTPRMITIEPVAHQYCQQAMLRWMRSNMPSILRPCIDFTNQKLSGDMALAASIDGKLATVDLSAASDRLSAWCVERLFRHVYDGELLEYLHACRSRWLSYEIAGERKFLTLRKYAGQGNATTFPVQSIFYACVAVAALLFEEGRACTYVNVRKCMHRIRVFGDDIIMPSFAVRSLVDLLGYLNLKVNVAKSHFQGNFRESCGVDAFRGHDVTPVYMASLALDKGPESLISWVDVCNNAHDKGLLHLAGWMTGQIPEETLALIHESAGNQGFLALRHSQESPHVSCRWRYNKHLQRSETLALQVVAKTTRKQRREYDRLLQYFLEAPKPGFLGIFPDWNSGYVVQNRLLLRKRWVPV